LAYSGVTPEEIEEGISRLAEVYREIAGMQQSAVTAAGTGADAA
jgi:hypothetical protein